jgi:catechol 2,3-dioxygenase-like lactoylglutathione lyase family enzyme
MRTRDCGRRINVSSDSVAFDGSLLQVLQRQNRSDEGRCPRRAVATLTHSVRDQQCSLPVGGGAEGDLMRLMGWQDRGVRPGPRIPTLRSNHPKTGEAGPGALIHILPADSLLLAALGSGRPPDTDQLIMERFAECIALGSAADMIVSMIGRMHHVVVDCPDPDALAGFYSALLGLPVTYRDDDWVVVAASGASSGLAFQRAPGNRPSTWPDTAVPQQFHLDIMVENAADAGLRVLALGAVKLDGEDVYADPAGHPFCLIPRPQWAPHIPDDA